MEKSKCSDCKYFRRHYIDYGGKHFVPINCGHCVYPRVKNREPENPACVHFKEAEKGFEPFDG